MNNKNPKEETTLNMGNTMEVPLITEGTDETYVVLNNQLLMSQMDLPNFAKMMAVFVKEENIGSYKEFAYDAGQVMGGYLRCDGAEYLKTDYPLLYSKIKDMYGDGTRGPLPSDADHFRVPNTIGYFLRDLDTTGTIDPEGTIRLIGDKQQDTLQNITGNLRVTAGVHGSEGVAAIGGAFNNAVHPSSQGAYQLAASSGKVEEDWDYYFDASAVVRTSIETRSKNISVTIYILAK